MNIEMIWKRIQKNSGEVFYTKRGIPFTYHTGENTLYFENTNCTIGKTTIERAMMVTEPTVVKLEKERIFGAPYVYGIITDKRIIG